MNFDYVDENKIISYYHIIILGTSLIKPKLSKTFWINDFCFIEKPKKIFPAWCLMSRMHRNTFERKRLFQNVSQVVCPLRFP